MVPLNSKSLALITRPQPPTPPTQPTCPCFLADADGVLLFGRIITGIGVGCCFHVAPLYIAEIAPKQVCAAGGLHTLPPTLPSWDLIIRHHCHNGVILGSRQSRRIRLSREDV